MNKDTTGTHTEILCKSLKETLTHSPTKKKKREKKEASPRTKQLQHWNKKIRNCHQETNNNIQIIPSNMYPSKKQPEVQQHLSIVLRNGHFHIILSPTWCKSSHKAITFYRTTFTLTSTKLWHGLIGMVCSHKRNYIWYLGWARVTLKCLLDAPFRIYYGSNIT